MNKRKKFFSEYINRPLLGIYVLFLSYTFFIEKIYAEEIDLYDKNGNASAYIDLADEAVIWSWEGEAVAYLDEENVYGWNGTHLGWFEDDFLFDHKGYIVCVTDNTKSFSALNKGFLPLKGLKPLKPLKGLQDFSPLKPIYKRQFSDIPCDYFLKEGALN